MGVGEIAGLIAAIAFAILAGFMIYPLIRLGKLFDQLAETVKETGDHAIPALDESVTTVQQVNKSLEDVNKISAAASSTVRSSTSSIERRTPSSSSGRTARIQSCQRRPRQTGQGR